MIMKISTTLFVSCFLLLGGCNKETSVSAQENVPVTETKKETQASTKVSDVVKIVFVGQKQACDCTRNRIDKVWTTLQSTLRGKHDIPVVRIQLDVDEEAADKLDSLRSLMVAPGIYFFDANENLLEMLQGEVTAEQISKVL